MRHRYNSQKGTDELWDASVRDMIACNGGYVLPRGYLEVPSETPLRRALRRLHNSGEIDCCAADHLHEIWA